jgi:peptide chain release factor 2
VAADFSVVLDELNTTLKSIEAVLRVDDMRNEIADLEQQAAAPDLWNDVEAAQALTSRLSFLQGTLRRVEELRSRLDDVALMHEMAEEEGDEATLAETVRELDSIRSVIDELEVRTLLSGEYDSREALVTIRSEAGGVDAADFAEMLMRMYLRWAERHKYPTEVYDVSYAEEAGIKSATFAVKVPYAYGTLSV